jgi:Family of unknown function (DUF6352)
MNKAETHEKPIWKSAGLHLTHRQKNGWLAVTPDLLRAYYTRPEIHPIEESCDVEHRIFERLMEDPFANVERGDIAAIVDEDARENYRLVVAFRDHLIRHGTIEGAYAALFAESEVPRIPPVFIEQLCHLIVSNILVGETDAFVARAGEMLFREQKANTADENLLLADAELVESYSQEGGFGGLGALIAQAGTPMRQITIDILAAENGDQYWGRADRFDMALDFRFTQPGPDAFARVLQRWVKHFLRVDTRIQAVQSIRDERWSWHVGLDTQASTTLNALYEGKPADASRFAGLFRLEFLDRSDILNSMAGKPIYLGLAMDGSDRIKVKPQNLLTNLPLQRQ